MITSESSCFTNLFALFWKPSPFSDHQDDHPARWRAPPPSRDPEEAELQEPHSHDRQIAQSPLCVSTKQAGYHPGWADGGPC